MKAKVMTGLSISLSPTKDMDIIKYLSDKEKAKETKKSLRLLSSPMGQFICNNGLDTMMNNTIKSQSIKSDKDILKCIRAVLDFHENISGIKHVEKTVDKPKKTGAINPFSAGAK